MRIHWSWLWMFSSCSPAGGETDKCCPLVEQLLLKQSHIVSFLTLIHTFYSPVDRQLTCPVFFRCAPKKSILCVDFPPTLSLPSFLLSQTCQRAPSIWSSTAWTATKTDCWGSSPGTNQPLTGPTRTGPRSWVSILRSASSISLSRRSGPSLWAFHYFSLRRRAGFICVTLASRSRFSRRWGSATTRPLDVNLSFLCTRHKRGLSDITLGYKWTVWGSYLFIASGNNWKGAIWPDWYFVTDTSVVVFPLTHRTLPGVSAHCVRYLLFLRGKDFLFFGLFW